MHTCIYTYASAYTFTHIYTCRYACVYRCINTHTPTHTHAYTGTLNLYFTVGTWEETGQWMMVKSPYYIPCDFQDVFETLQKEPSWALWPFISTLGMTGCSLAGCSEGGMNFWTHIPSHAAWHMKTANIVIIPVIITMLIKSCRTHNTEWWLWWPLWFL